MKNFTSVEENQLKQLTNDDKVTERLKKNRARDERISSSRNRNRNKNSGSGRRKSGRRKTGGRQSRRRSKPSMSNTRDGQRQNNKYGGMKGNKYRAGLRYRSHQADSTAHLDNEVVTPRNVSKAASKNLVMKSCSDLKCEFGGRCVEEELRAGVRCQCPLGTQGPTCSKGELCVFQGGYTHCMTTCQ